MSPHALTSCDPLEGVPVLDNLQLATKVDLLLLDLNDMNTFLLGWSSCPAKVGYSLWDILF